MTQEPEPTWQEPKGERGFWGWKVSESWDFDTPDLTGFEYDTRIAVMDITSPMARAISGLSNQAVLLFIPHRAGTNFISDVSIAQWDAGDWSKYWLGDSFNAGYGSEDCVPYLIVRHAGKTKTSECGGMTCTDTTLERAFDGTVTSQCTNERLPSGEVCQRQRYGITFSLQTRTQSSGWSNLTVAAPWRSLAGFRSNIITKYTRNSWTETDRTIQILNGYDGLGDNFAKLNINDIDATSEIFDPRSTNGNFIEPVTINTTLASTFSNAKAVYKSFTKGSSANRLPRSISVTLNGVPSDLNKVLDLKSLKDWNINLGQDGISMSLNYADAPSTPPAMDYLQSRLHNQFHYTTINGQ